MLSELALKLGTNQPLSPGEIEQLRMALINLEQNRAYIAALQSGRASLSLEKLTAVTAEFRFQPINMARMYSYDDQDVSNFIKFDATYTEFETNSYFELDPADNTKLLLKLPIAYLDQHRYLLAGYMGSDDANLTSLDMNFYNGSDVKVDAQTLVASKEILAYFAYTFPSCDTDITNVTYIKFEATLNPTHLIVVEMYINLVR